MTHPLSPLPISRRIGPSLQPQLLCRLLPRASSSLYDSNHRLFGSLTETDLCLLGIRDAPLHLGTHRSLSPPFSTVHLDYSQTYISGYLSPCVTLFSRTVARFRLIQEHIHYYLFYDIGISVPGLFAPFLYEVLVLDDNAGGDSDNRVTLVGDKHPKMYVRE